MERICKHCELSFDITDKSKGWMANHVRWCSKNPNRNDYNKSNNTGSGAIKAKELRIMEYSKAPKQCKECSVILEYNSRQNKFCGSSCAATFNNNKRERVKWSDESKAKLAKKFEDIKVHKTNISFCLNCKRCVKGTRKYCDMKCQKRFKYSFFNDMKLYRKMCNFTFNLSDFPNGYDFSLIEKYGWYKAKNRGDNPNGVSRDHIISVKYGFDNNIPTWIISHPANCQLLPHSINNKKKTNCDLTLEELLNKIEHWGD